MRRVYQAIVVEGKHDVIRVRSAVEAVVVSTDGFRVFKDKEKMALLRRLAATRGLIGLTDSDTAGGVIRSHLCGSIPAEQMWQAYIPPRPGKERRKAAPSKEGLLGVEGMEADRLRAMFAPFAVGSEGHKKRGRAVEKRDFYADGLSGGEGAAEKREALAAYFSLPRGMSANALLEAINLLYDYEAYKEALRALPEKQ